MWVVLQSGQSSESEWSLSSGVSHVFDRAPPAVLRHVAEPERFDWHPLALHPLELARQLTLLEFHLYRQVRPLYTLYAIHRHRCTQCTLTRTVRWNDLNTIDTGVSTLASKLQAVVKFSIIS